MHTDVQTLEGKQSLAMRTGILSFVVLKFTMNDEKSIEEFLPNLFIVIAMSSVAKR